MRLRLLSGWCVVSMLGAGLVAVACGSNPTKKRAPQYESGGDGGDTAAAGVGNSNSHGGQLTAQAGETARGGAGRGGVGGANGGTSSMSGATAGVPETSDGGAGGVPGAPFHGLYIGPSGLGSDTADGTEEAPFLTLAHAASLAQPGDTIVFLDGTYALGAVVATAIADGVDLMAQNSGEVTLSGSGDLLKLSGSTRIQGLTFKSFAHVVTYPSGVDATGRLTIEDTSFSNCTVACLDLPGAVEASVTSATDAIVGNGGNGFALLSNTAKLKMSGGILEAFGSAGVIRATDDSNVSLADLQILDGTGPVLVTDKNTVAVVDGVTVATQGQGLFDQKGQSSLSVKNSDVSMRAGTPTVYYCFLLEMDGVGSLLVEDSHVHDCNCGFKGNPPASLAITRSEVHDMGFGVDLDNGGPEIGGSLRITDSMFFGFSTFALRTASGSGLMDIKVRGSSFAGAASPTWHTIYLQGASGSVFDLGTGADPGRNTFLSSSTSYSGLFIALAAATTLASGNTWTPLQQSADAAGHYSAPAGAGNTLDTTSTAAGQNYSKPYTGTLRLAENAP